MDKQRKELFHSTLSGRKPRIPNVSRSCILNLCRAQDPPNIRVLPIEPELQQEAPKCMEEIVDSTLQCCMIAICEQNSSRKGKYFPFTVDYYVAFENF